QFACSFIKDEIKREITLRNISGGVTIGTFSNFINVTDGLCNSTTSAPSQDSLSKHQISISKAEHRVVGVHKVCVIIRNHLFCKRSIPEFRNGIAFGELCDVGNLQRLALSPKQGP